MKDYDSSGLTKILKDFPPANTVVMSEPLHAMFTKQRVERDPVDRPLKGSPGKRKVRNKKRNRSRAKAARLARKKNR